MNKDLVYDKCFVKIYYCGHGRFTVYFREFIYSHFYRPDMETREDTIEAANHFMMNAGRKLAELKGRTRDGRT